MKPSLTQNSTSSTAQSVYSSLETPPETSSTPSRSMPSIPFTVPS